MFSGAIVEQRTNRSMYDIQMKNEHFSKRECIPNARQKERRTSTMATENKDRVYMKRKSMEGCVILNSEVKH